MCVLKVHAVSPRSTFDMQSAALLELGRGTHSLELPRVILLCMKVDALGIQVPEYNVYCVIYFPRGPDSP